MKDKSETITMNEKQEAVARAGEPGLDADNVAVCAEGGDVAAEAALAVEQAGEQAVEQAREQAVEQAGEQAGEQAEAPDPLAEALKEMEGLKDKYLRSVAEFDNYRKRTIKEKAELILNGAERAVQAMLPVVDDMERALASAKGTDDAAAVREGVELIYQKLVKALGGLGVKAIDTEDADFDTDFHEAIAMVPGKCDDKKGKVLECVQKGYTLNGKVIRHAKVAVGQ